MMSKEASQADADVLAGKFKRGIKKDGTDAKYFNVFVFEIDPKTMQPKVIGEIEIKGKKYPKHKIIRSFRIAEASILKVAAGEQTSCNVYWKVRR